LKAQAAKPAAARRGPLAQLAGSLIFTGFLFVWTFLYAIPFVLACLVLPFPRRYALVRLYAASTLAMLRWCCGLTYQVEGTLPQGAHVAFWKHSSSWETIAMMVVCPRQVWVLKRELLWIPVVGQGIWLMHAIAIDRKAGHSAVSQVVEQGRERLAEGDWVIIFPEGTRMPAGETRLRDSTSQRAFHLARPIQQQLTCCVRSLCRFVPFAPIPPSGRSVRVDSSRTAPDPDARGPS